MGRKVEEIHHDGERVFQVQTRNALGEVETWPAEEFILSMPLRETVLGLRPRLSAAVDAAARGLRYRDFLIVALMVEGERLFPDNWIYVHDPEVRVGRVQNFNNWSPDMVAQPGGTCLGLEYFCNTDEPLWNAPDSELVAVAKSEAGRLGLIDPGRVVDGCVVRMEKAYPVYDVTYQAHVATIRAALSTLKNLQTVGRNGMHKYNNQDHAMLTGMLAARNLKGIPSDPWRVNTDAEYLEAGQADKVGRLVPCPAPR
jgi:protoporphyrinogen oxidase